MASLNTIYIKPGLSSCVSEKNVCLGMVCEVYSNNRILASELKNLEIFCIREEKKQKIAISVLDLIEKIMEKEKDAVVINIGESDFVLEYEPKKSTHKGKGIAKVVFVSIVVFFGSAFTIMTFNEDANVSEIFTRIYVVVAGMQKSNGILEISYCIGLPLGILLFFNHFSTVKLSTDPTPLQIQMRQYEQQENETIIENEARKGKHSK